MLYYWDIALIGYRERKGRVKIHEVSPLDLGNWSMYKYDNGINKGVSSEEGKMFASKRPAEYSKDIYVDFIGICENQY